MEVHFLVLKAFAEMRTTWLDTLFKNPDEIELEFAYFEADFERALAMHRALPDDRRESVVNLERRSLIELALGDCAASLASLDTAHDGELRIYTQVAPDYERSNPNLAANRAWCLRQQGDLSGAAEVVAAARVYYDRVRRDYGSFFRLEAKLLAAAGDNEAALGVLEEGVRAGTLSWIEINDGLLLQAFAGEPRFEEVRRAIWDTVNGRRREAGWPATDDRLAWDSGEPFPGE